MALYDCGYFVSATGECGAEFAYGTPPQRVSIKPLAQEAGFPPTCALENAPPGVRRQCEAAFDANRQTLIQIRPRFRPAKATK